MGGSDLRLPAHLGLAEDLGRGLELHAAVEEDSAHDDGVGAHDFLVVVCVRCDYLILAIPGYQILVSAPGSTG